MHQGVEVAFSINSAGTSKKQKYPPVSIIYENVT